MLLKKILSALQCRGVIPVRSAPLTRVSVKFLSCRQHQDTADRRSIIANVRPSCKRLVREASKETSNYKYQKQIQEHVDLPAVKLDPHSMQCAQSCIVSCLCHTPVLSDILLMRRPGWTVCC